MAPPKWGLHAVAIYIAAVVIGGLLDPSYSHIRQAVSELVAVGAPNKPLLVSLFAVYNLGLLLFALRRGSRSFAVAAVLGFIVLFVPMNLSAPQSASHVGHLILVSLLALAALATTLPQRHYGWSLLLIVTGIVAGVSAARGAKYLGLAERASIGSFLGFILRLESESAVKTE